MRQSSSNTSAHNGGGGIPARIATTNRGVHHHKKAADYTATGDTWQRRNICESATVTGDGINSITGSGVVDGGGSGGGGIAFGSGSSFGSVTQDRPAGVASSAWNASFMKVKVLNYEYLVRVTSIIFYILVFCF